MRAMAKMYAQIDFKVCRKGYLCISKDINNSIDWLMVNSETMGSIYNYRGIERTIHISIDEP